MGLQSCLVLGPEWPKESSRYLPCFPSVNGLNCVPIKFTLKP